MKHLEKYAKCAGKFDYLEDCFESIDCCYVSTASDETLGDDPALFALIVLMLSRVAEKSVTRFIRIRTAERIATGSACVVCRLQFSTHDWNIPPALEIFHRAAVGVALINMHFSDRIVASLRECQCQHQCQCLERSSYDGAADSRILNREVRTEDVGRHRNVGSDTSHIPKCIQSFLARNVSDFNLANFPENKKVSRDWYLKSVII